MERVGETARALAAKSPPALAAAKSRSTTRSRATTCRTWSARPRASRAVFERGCQGRHDGIRRSEAGLPAAELTGRWLCPLSSGRAGSSFVTTKWAWSSGRASSSRAAGRAGNASGSDARSLPVSQREVCARARRRPPPARPRRRSQPPTRRTARAVAGRPSSTSTASAAASRRVPRRSSPYGRRAVR